MSTEKRERLYDGKVLLKASYRAARFLSAESVCWKLGASMLLMGKYLSVIVVLNVTSHACNLLRPCSK